MRSCKVRSCIFCEPLLDPTPIYETCGIGGAPLPYATMAQVINSRSPTNYGLRTAHQRPARKTNKEALVNRGFSPAVAQVFNKFQSKR
jgi:hypothetical protein